MKVRSVVMTAGLVVAIVVTGCSGGGSSSSSAKPAATTLGKGTAPPTPVSTTVLPANTPKSEQFCAQSAALAEKFKGATKPTAPAEMVPYLRDIAAFLAQSISVAPPVLVPDLKKLSLFYGPLADRVASGSSASPGTGFQLGDLAASSARLREYFSRFCGVDDKVFNF